LTQIYPKTDYIWVWVGQPAQQEFAGLFGLFDETVAIDAWRFQARSSLGYRLRTMWRLSGLSGDVVIHPVRSRTFLVGDALARALAAPVKIASRGDTSNSPHWQLRLGDRFYTRVLSWTDPGHELQFTADFMAQLGAAGGIAPHPALRAIARQAPGPDITEPYFVVLPGAGWAGREWGVHRFMAAAGRIQQENGWLCVWAGSADERRRLSPSLEPAQLRAVDLMGKTSTVELLRLIAGARMVLTNEAGGAHLAAACGVPTVVIAGGGHVDRFVPWGSMTTVVNTMPCFGCNWDCIHPLRSHEPVPCIASIDVARVPHRTGQR
jgi:ADP-heptose:LPS heptosyltransferase